MSSKKAQIKSGASEIFQNYIPKWHRDTYYYYYHEINIQLPANHITHKIQTKDHGLTLTSFTFNFLTHTDKIHPFVPQILKH
jgi:hypothetical protein